MEVGEPPHNALHVVLRRQKGCPKVPGAVALAEARAGHDDNARLLEQRHGVEGVGRLAGRLSGGERLGRERDAREGVHGTLRRLAGDALKLVQRVDQLDGTALERAEDALLLGHVALIRGVARLRRLHHQPSDELPNRVGAQADGRHLEDLRLDLRVEADDLHVAAAQPALAEEALGGRVEGDELQRRLGAHLAEHLLERVERPSRVVNILLVHFVGHEHEIVARAEVDDVAHVLDRQAVARRVARVDHDERAHVDPLGLGRVQGALELLNGQRPCGLLRQIVPDKVSVLKCESGRVERVLRDRHEHSVLLVAQDELDH
mmetsp:Transcript_26079/g.54739  ORF Transcript_26079/g.54739 Transcript_26079/m.54739 type:complete len:319 (+) Transcript_26079:413-1369(+)